MANRSNPLFISRENHDKKIAEYDAAIAGLDARLTTVSKALDASASSVNSLNADKLMLQQENYRLKQTCNQQHERIEGLKCAVDQNNHTITNNSNQLNVYEMELTEWRNGSRSNNKLYEQLQNLVETQKKEIQRLQCVVVRHESKPKFTSSLAERNETWMKIEQRKMMSQIISESLIPTGQDMIDMDADKVFTMVNTAKRVVDEICRRVP